MCNDGWRNARTSRSCCQTTTHLFQECRTKDPPFRYRRACCRGWSQSQQRHRPRYFREQRGGAECVLLLLLSSPLSPHACCHLYTPPSIPSTARLCLHTSNSSYSSISTQATEQKISTHVRDKVWRPWVETFRCNFNPDYDKDQENVPAEETVLWWFDGAIPPLKASLV